jgi:hypothetical protein
MFKRSSADYVEYGALALLSVGALLGTAGVRSAVLSTIALAICGLGLILLWSSKIWHTTDKIVGTTLLPIGFWVIELIYAYHRISGVGFFVLIDRALVVFIVVTDVMVSVAALAYLVIRLQRETQENRSDSSSI